MGSKNSASPHASFILTRRYFFIVSFTSIYILSSRHSNNINLNLCLLNKQLYTCLVAVFKIFKIVKRVFLLCFYVRDNRVFPTGGSPATSLKFAHPSHQEQFSPHQASSSSIKFLFLTPTKSLSPPLNNNFQVITQ